MDTPLDVQRTRIAGSRSRASLVALAGVALAVLVSSNWEYLKGAVKITGAVQSGVVAGAVFLIGAALFYASRPQGASRAWSGARSRRLARVGLAARGGDNGGASRRPPRARARFPRPRWP